MNHHLHVIVRHGSAFSITKFKILLTTFEMKELLSMIHSIVFWGSFLCICVPKDVIYHKFIQFKTIIKSSFIVYVSSFSISWSRHALVVFRRINLTIAGLYFHWVSWFPSWEAHPGTAAEKCTDKCLLDRPFHFQSSFFSLTNNFSP